MASKSFQNTTFDGDTEEKLDYTITNAKHLYKVLLNKTSLVSRINVGLII